MTTASGLRRLEQLAKLEATLSVAADKEEKGPDGEEVKKEGEEDEDADAADLEMDDEEFDEDDDYFQVHNLLFLLCCGQRLYNMFILHGRLLIVQKCMVSAGSNL